MTDQAASTRQALATRVLVFWADMRGSMRALLAEAPGEGRLLALAMVSGLITFLATVTGMWLDPATAAIGPDELTARVAAAFVGALLFRTLFLYGLAALAGLGARAAGGRGDWRETRAAVFWASLVAAPVGFAATLADRLGPMGAGAAGVVLQSLAPMALAVALSACLAEAHGFRRAWLVFLGVSVAVLGVVTAIRLAGVD